MPALSNPITWLPSKTPEGDKRTIDVEVVPMTLALIKRWKSSVQPIIDDAYAHYHEGCDPLKARADVGWNWRANWLLTKAHDLGCKMPGIKSGPSQALCMVVDQDGEKFPIGMLTVVPSYFCNVKGWGHRAFTWYLADAPSEVYDQVLGQPRVQGVARALLDCTIQSALDHSQSGELLLHADPKGGEKLIEFYKDRCSMTRLAADNGDISLTRRGPSDEYFHWDQDMALEFCAQNDVRRTNASSHRSVLG